MISSCHVLGQYVVLDETLSYMKLNSMIWTSEMWHKLGASNTQIAIISENLRHNNFVVLFDLQLSMQELLIHSPILTLELILNLTFLTLLLLKSSFPSEQKLSNLKSFNEKTFLSEEAPSHLHFIFQMNTHHRLIQSGRKLHNSNYFLLTSF